MQIGYNICIICLVLLVLMEQLMRKRYNRCKKQVNI